MGDERADRGSGGARERLAERTRERDRIIDRYETLLDAARGSDDAPDDADRSRVARLLDKLRRA
jgi:sirohydrochlorin ferrochelatase